MNVGLFGGTFDPIHRGHLAVARAAAKKFRLERIYFVPSSLPPHRQGRPLTPYHHRFAMVTLATRGIKNFIPSALEAPKGAGFSYSIDTVRALKRELGKRGRVFFIIGIDAFRDIAKWHQAEALLREVDFIVVSRPGYALADVGEVLPEDMRPDRQIIKLLKKAKGADVLAGDFIILGTTMLYLLRDVAVCISATQVRAAARQGEALGRFVDPAVAEYIRKTRLYRSGIRENRGSGSR